MHLVVVLLKLVGILDFFVIRSLNNNRLEQSATHICLFHMLTNNYKNKEPVREKLSLS